MCGYLAVVYRCSPGPQTRLTVFLPSRQLLFPCLIRPSGQTLVPSIATAVPSLPRGTSFRFASDQILDPARLRSSGYSSRYVQFVPASPVMPAFIALSDRDPAALVPASATSNIADCFKSSSNKRLMVSPSVAVFELTASANFRLNIASVFQDEFFMGGCSRGGRPFG